MSFQPQLRSRARCANTIFAASSAKRCHRRRLRHRPGLRLDRRRRAAARVAVGRDGRLLLAGTGDEPDRRADGERHRRALASAAGPTPMLYFAAFTEPTDGGVMVTGSHNPSNYNGFKMMLGKKPFFGQDILDLGAARPPATWCRKPKAASPRKDVSEAYIARLMQDWDGERKLKIVWDNGNGAAGEVLAKLLQKLPGEHTRAERQDRRQLPGPPPGPDRAEKPRAADRRREKAARRYRRGVRWRRRPHRPRRQLRAYPVRRPVPDPDGARRAEVPARVPPSSPTSRPARCCSTRSTRPAGRR